MLSRTVVGLLGGLSCFAFASLSHAQCSKDTDCKGDRVCEAGSCVSPAPLPPAPAAPAPAPAPATDASAVASSPSAVAPQAAPSAAVSEPLDRDREERRREKPPRHSTGMMAGGIVMVSFVPIALLVSLVANLEQDACETGGHYLSAETTRVQDTNCSRFDATIYGGLIAGLGLAGAGIPLIVIGGKREPIGTASVTPWATQGAGGLRLRVDL